MVSMILTIEISVSLFRVSHHLIGPFEEGLVFNIFQDLMHGLSEYSSDYLVVTGYLLLSVIPSRPVIIIPVRPEFSPFLRDKLSFPFSLLLLLLIIFYPFILIHSIYQLLQAGDQFPCQGLSQTMLGGKPNLEGSDSDLIKIPSISLNISQYLSAYDLTDSPSLIVIDNRESRG